MSWKRKIEREYYFQGSLLDLYTWTKRITGAAPPTVLVGNGGVSMALTATNQAQHAGISFNDILPFSINEICRVEFLISITASFAGYFYAAVGSAANDDIEAVAAFAGFKGSGSNTVLVSTDDGSNDVSDKSTGGLTLGTTKKLLVIDFETGIKSNIGALSKGGKADVLFSMEDERGNLRSVARDSRFDMSGYSGGLQPLIGIGKASGTGTGTLTLERIKIVKREG